MDEARSHSRGRELEAVPPRSNHLLKRVCNAAKVGPAHCEASKDAQATPSPRSSPSPIDPFVCFDSAPSTSPSNAVEGSHCSTCDARKAQTQHSASESYPSYANASRLPSGSLELTMDSLEHHLRHGDVDPKETKHSFILERFLPAAKTVAADHDRTAYSVGKPAMMLNFSPILHSSSTAMSSDNTSSELDASKNSANEYLPCCNQDDDNESVDAEMMAKSCGFFCAGLRRLPKPCTHNMAHAPLRDLMTKKSLATQLAGHRRSLKEDLKPKVKITLMEGIQRQGPTFVPDLKGLLYASPSENPSQSMSSSSGGYCNDHSSKTSNLNSGPLANLCGDCQSNHFSHQVPPSAKQYQPCDATSNRQCMASSCLSYTHQSFEDSNLYTECQVTENALRCSCYSVSAHDDDELEFHDASSRLEMLCTQSSNSYSQESKSANYQDHSLSAQISASDVSRLFEAHLPSTKEKEILTDDEGHVKVVRKEHSTKDAKERPKVVNPALVFKCNTSSGFAETANGAYMNSHQKNTGHSHKKCLASSLPGWPLGISSLQSGRNKILSQDAEYVHDISAAKISNHKKSLSMELLPPPVRPSPATSPWLGKALALKASKPPYLATLQQQRNVRSVQKKQLFNVSPDEKKGVKWEDVVKRSKVCPDYLKFPLIE